jgi:NADPH:quinone reductase-like Zn-dependent oxidoreductase
VQPLQSRKEENSMKAMVRYAYGPPDVLELREIDIPEIADDEVLVRVHAAGVGRDVWHVLTGLPYPIRLAGYGFRAPNNPVIGSDVAGVVEAVGKNVSTFQPGDEVFGIGKGSYAEYVCAREDKLAPKPSWGLPPCKPCATMERYVRGRKC